MSSQVRMGDNKTGLMASPDEAKQMLEADDVLQSQISGDISEFVEIKSHAIAEAHRLGSVPPPKSVKGAVKAGTKMIRGENLQVFMDKLAERAAFERGGTRLYDALILKFQPSDEALTGATLERLTQIREDELAHYHLIVGAVRALGGDPTAQTPSADLVGVETMGLMQVLNDPRTTFTDCLNAMLVAELADTDAWSLLAQLADDIGEEDWAKKFRQALLDENGHLQDVRNWYQTGVKALQ